MRKQSYAEIIHINGLMLNGIKNYTEQMAKRGIREEFTEKMLRVCERAVELNTEQERLKARLKMTTAQLEELLAELLRMQSEIKNSEVGVFPGVMGGVRDQG